MSGSTEGDAAVVIERRSGSGIGIFLLGVAIGAGLALLYAPQTGAETRADLRRGARRLRRKARDVADGAQEAVHDLAHTARDAARQTRDALEQRLARHQRAGREAVHDGEDEGV